MRISLAGLRLLVVLAVVVVLMVMLVLVAVVLVVTMVMMTTVFRSSASDEGIFVHPNETLSTRCGEGVRLRIRFGCLESHYRPQRWCGAFALIWSWRKGAVGTTPRADSLHLNCTEELRNVLR